MTKLSAAVARNEFSEILNRAAFGKERIVLTRRGKDLAAIVPIEDLELLERLEDRIDLEDARAALAEVRESGTVTWEKIKSDLGL
jgi:prevent-host-death family protein